MTRIWTIAGFALAAAAFPLALLGASHPSVINKADCPPGWWWDVDLNQCVNAPNPVLGPAGPVGVGPDPVLGPAGPVGVGPDPVLGPAGPVGVGPDPVLGPAGPVGVGHR